MTSSKFILELAIPQGVEVRQDGDYLVAKGPKGEAKVYLSSPRVGVLVENGKLHVKIIAEKTSKRDKMIFNTFRAHFRNLLSGVSEGVVYKMKICSGHFPMNVSLKGKNLEVKNFYGESVPRRLVLKDDVKVKIEGDMLILEGASKELVGTVAGDIEQMVRISNRDRRIFQDGIFIVEKNGKAL